MDPLALGALAAAALLVGATGTWSPCGFSMVETIGPTGHTGGRRTAIAACATFLPGALAGGLLTFGGLALAGELVHGAGGRWAYAIAAAVALAAAVAEARGARIAPQIRRQLPEHWRRVMPMPLAAALYGVLLGIGFTTFVLTFGVWALAGVALALGEPAAGLAIGLGFGLGRALPIVALAPVADRPAGRRALELMAERPGLYRGIRLGDAVALAVVAGGLAMASSTQAEVERVKPAADPSADFTGLATQRGVDRVGELRDGSGTHELPGTDPALGGGLLALLDGEDVVVMNPNTMVELDRETVPGADALALSAQVLAVRTRSGGRDAIEVRELGFAGEIGEPMRIASRTAPGQLGRPSVWDTRVAYAVATSKRNRILSFDVATGERRKLISSPRYGLSNPALRKQRLLYVRSVGRRNELRLRALGRGRDKLLRAGRARLWSTSLTGTRAYVTVLRGSLPHARVVSEGL